MARIATAGANLPKSMAKSRHQVIEHGICIQTGKGAAVVVGCRGKGIEHLAQTVRTRVCNGTHPCRGNQCYGKKTRITTPAVRTVITDIHISVTSIFFPRYSGIRPIMRPAVNTAITTKASMV